jgi:hypothetical protein
MKNGANLSACCAGRSSPDRWDARHESPDAANAFSTLLVASIRAWEHGLEEASGLPVDEPFRERLRLFLVRPTFWAIPDRFAEGVRRPLLMEATLP